MHTPDKHSSRAQRRGRSKRVTAALVSPQRALHSMMMAHDAGTPPPSPLADETIAALKDALRRYLSDGQSPSPLQTALMLAAREAHANHILPEQLLVPLKDLWSSLPQARAMSAPTEQVRLLHPHVTPVFHHYHTL